MKQDIESYLRQNKPKVQDNPVFLLEVQQKMRTVDGIKAEVDRQRRYGRITLIVALVTGIIIGAAGIVMVYLYPINPETISNGELSNIRGFFETYKQPLLLTVAIFSLILGLLFTRRETNRNFI